MDDVHFDMRLTITQSGQGVAYSVDSSHEDRNRFTVLDLGTGTSSRHLNQHPSTLRMFEDVPAYQRVPFYQRTGGQPLGDLQGCSDGAEAQSGWE